jgi:hypothetical protein
VTSGVDLRTFANSSSVRSSGVRSSSMSICSRIFGEPAAAGDLAKSIPLWTTAQKFWFIRAGLVCRSRSSACSTNRPFSTVARPPSAGSRVLSPIATKWSSSGFAALVKQSPGGIEPAESASLSTLIDALRATIRSLSIRHIRQLRTRRNVGGRRPPRGFEIVGNPCRRV